MRKLLFLFVVGFIAFTEVECQYILITKAGDTIRCINYDYSIPKTKYWISGSNKTYRISTYDIATQIKYPIYKIEKNETDEFTGFRIIETKGITIGSSKPNTSGWIDGLHAWFSKIETPDLIGYYLNLRTAINIGCAGVDGNYITIKFENGDLLTLEEHTTEINCNKAAISTFIIDETALNKLKENKFKAIRFCKSKSYQDFYTMFPESLSKSLSFLDN